MKIKDLKIDMKSHDLPLGIVRKNDEGELIVVEVDKDMNELDEYKVNDIFEQYLDLECIKLKLEYKHEEEVE